jgi:hypothetical protein
MIVVGCIIGSLESNNLSRSRENEYREPVTRILVIVAAWIQYRCSLGYAIILFLKVLHKSKSLLQYTYVCMYACLCMFMLCRKKESTVTEE